MVDQAVAKEFSAKLYSSHTINFVVLRAVEGPAADSGVQLSIVQNVPAVPDPSRKRSVLVSKRQNSFLSRNFATNLPVEIVVQRAPPLSAPRAGFLLQFQNILFHFGRLRAVCMV